MQNWEIDNGILNIRLSDDGLKLRISSRHGFWESDNFIRAVYGKEVPLELLKFGKTHVSKENGALRLHIDDVVWYARFLGHGYLKPEPAPDITFDFRIELDGDEVLFITCPPHGLDDEPMQINFPVAPLRWDPCKTGDLCGAFGSLGSLYQYPSAEHLDLNYRTILPVAGFFRPEGGTGIRTADIYDFRILLSCNGKTGTGAIVFEFNRGKSEYERTVRMKFFPAGSNYVDLAMWHRESVRRESRFRSLAEKIAADPEVGKLAGSVIWKHNVYPGEVPAGIRKDYSLYVRSMAAAEAEGRPGNWSAKEVFDAARTAGFDRVCIFNTGWNNKGFDSGYPTRFPVNPERGDEESFRKAAEYGRSLSPDYIFCVHDNYRDVYPNSPEFTFGEVMTDRTGGKIMGGIWRGGRCYLECGKCTLKYAERDLPHIASMCGRGAIYLDVQGCVDLRNCCHPDHPGSRRDDAQWRLETFRIAKKYIGAVATEGAPHEFAVRDIDLGAYPPIKSGSAPNMKPIPFFQLVYHDSVFSFCGQGVSGVYGAEYVNRVALYGMLPWDFGPASLRISKDLRRACTEPMLLHEFCGDGVEHTVFADGTEVFANFSNQTEMNVPPEDFIIRKTGNTLQPEKENQR